MIAFFPKDRVDFSMSKFLAFFGFDRPFVHTFGQGSACLSEPHFHRQIDVFYTDQTAFDVVVQRWYDHLIAEHVVPFRLSAHRIG